jgi:amino acid transporter
LHPTSAAGQADREGLVRAVSRWEIVGLAVNDVIGSGVYLLPASAAMLLGSASVLAVIVAGVAVALLVLCFAEAASYFEETGSGYLYTRTAFGPFLGFQVGWMTWLARVASVAALSAGAAQAAAFLWPGADHGGARTAIIALPLALLTWINVVGVKQGARAAVGLSIAKSLPLIGFVAVGLPHIDGSRVANLQLPDGGRLGEAALLLLFAYSGFENTAAAAGEFTNPRRNVPFALVTMIIFVTLLYSLVQLVAVGTLPSLAESESPLAEAAAAMLGPSAALVMTLGALISIEGNIGATTLAGPRYLFALAREGFGPAGLARIHPRWRTPAVAIVVQSTIALALALSGSFVALVKLSIIARLATYLGTASALLVLRRKFAAQESHLRLPGGPAIPLAAIALCLALLASATAPDLIAAGIALGIGSIIYLLRRRPRAGSSFEVR